MDLQEIFVDDPEARFRQQEKHVRDAAVQTILDGDDRPVGAGVAHRVDRILEAEAGQRQRVARIVHRGEMRIGARRALEGERARRIGRGGAGHPRRRGAARGAGSCPMSGARA